MNKESMPILTKEKNLLHFWEDAVEHNIQGRMLFDKVLFMRITTPGDRSEVIYEIDREYPEGYPNPVYGKIKKNEEIYKRYGEYIEQYKRNYGNDQPIIGVPIDSWAQVDVRRAAQLKFLGIFAVEQLATLHDGGIQAIGMGGRELVQKAKDFIAQKEDSALAMKLAEEKRQLQTQIDSLKEQMAELAGAMEELPPEARAEVQQTIVKRRGRPPKVQAA